jgi:hypothetical protein
MEQTEALADFTVNPPGVFHFRPRLRGWVVRVVYRGGSNLVD